MKTCRDCGITKPIDEFGTERSRRNLCRVCNRIQSAKYRKTEKGQAYIRAYSKKRYLKFKQKSLARAKVSRAILSGKLIKPTQCSKCQNETVIYGHHEDYDKPLDVIWLCEPCHKHLHGRLSDMTLLSKEIKE